MFYIHGGGFTFGSSYELPSHEGAQMARHHDVVQVSVNHRLNILGFLDVSEIGGSAYEDSVNVGMTDLVAALRWVHDNIENFGGDPDRVMIYGQSGGGSKVTTLMGMPSAAGLFHRASAQSGGGGNIPTQGAAKRSCPPADEGPWARAERYRIAAEDGVGQADCRRQRGRCQGQSAGAALMGPGAPGTPRAGWSPCVDGKVINMRSFFDAAPEVSKNVPMLIGSVCEEGNRMSSRPTEEEWHANLARAYGDEKATAIIATLKKAYPDKKIQTLSYMCGGAGGLNGLSMRNNVVKMAQSEARTQGRARLCVLLHVADAHSRWPAGAWHTAELQFCFDNTKRCEQGTGNTPEAQALAKKMASCMGDFCRNRKAEHPGLDMGADRS